MGIDLNAGVTLRTHPRGFRVAMYKHHPGKFFDISGREVAVSVAKEAGYDTDRLTQERNRRLKLADAEREINAQFGIEHAEMEQVAEASGRTVKHVGGGKYGIFDDEGNRLTTSTMTKEQAEGLLHSMAEDGGDDGS